MDIFISDATMEMMTIYIIAPLVIWFVSRKR